MPSPARSPILQNKFQSLAQLTIGKSREGVTDAGIDPQIDGVAGGLEVFRSLEAMRFPPVLAADHEEISWCTGRNRGREVDCTDVAPGHRDDAGEDVRIAGAYGHRHEASLGKTGQDNATFVDKMCLFDILDGQLDQHFRFLEVTPEETSDMGLKPVRYRQNGANSPG